MCKQLEGRLQRLGQHRANLQRDLQLTERDILIVQGMLAVLQHAQGQAYDASSVPFDLQTLTPDVAGLL
jgi:hypothetical protein